MCLLDCYPLWMKKTLAECTPEEYIMIVEFLCPKIEESQVSETETGEQEGGVNKKLKIENGSFLEYLDKLCSDENFVRMVETTLNIDYLNSLLSSDPEPLDLFALEKQDQQVLRLVPQEQSHPPFETNLHPVTKETSIVTSEVQSSNLDSAATQLELNLKQDGQTANQNTAVPKKNGISCSPLMPSHYLEDTTDATLEYYTPFSALSEVWPGDSLFLDHSYTSYLLSPPNKSLNSDLEERDYNALAAKTLENISVLDMSEETSFPSVGDNLQPGQSPNKIHSVQLHGGLSSVGSLSTTGVWGHKDPPVARKKTPDCFRADLLADSHSVDDSDMSGLAPKRPHALPQTSTPIGNNEKQCSPKILNLKCSYLEDMPHLPEDNHGTTCPDMASTSPVSDCLSDSCNSQVNGNSDLVPVTQILEAVNRFSVSQEFASFGKMFKDQAKDIHSKQICFRKTLNFSPDIEIPHLSPMTRAVFKSKAGLKPRMIEQKPFQMDIAEEDDDRAYTMSIPNAINRIDAEDKLISNTSSLTGLGTSEDERNSTNQSCVMKTRMSLRGAHFHCELPTRYKDFIVYQPKTRGQRQVKEKERKE